MPAEPSTVYTMEAVNLVCGDIGDEAQPGLSTYLSIQEIKLPGLEENYVDYLPGGAPVAIEINTHVNRLEATFSLAGWQPNIMRLIGRSARAVQRYTMYGVIRDQRSGRALKAMALLWGRMGRVNPTNYRKGDLMAHEYSIRGITHYELSMQSGPTAGNTEPSNTLQNIYYWDFFAQEFRVGEINIRAEENAILGIVSGGIAGDLGGTTVG